jgi:hypothetical protein
MFSLKPPRHISTLPQAAVGQAANNVRSTADSRPRDGRRVYSALSNSGGIAAAHLATGGSVKLKIVLPK